MSINDSCMVVKFISCVGCGYVQVCTDRIRLMCRSFSVLVSILYMYNQMRPNYKLIRRF